MPGGDEVGSVSALGRLVEQLILRAREAPKCPGLSQKKPLKALKFTEGLSLKQSLLARPQRPLPWPCPRGERRSGPLWESRGKAGSAQRACSDLTLSVLSE